MLIYDDVINGTVLTVQKIGFGRMDILHAIEVLLLPLVREHRAVTVMVRNTFLITKMSVFACFIARAALCSFGDAFLLPLNGCYLPTSKPWKAPSYFCGNEEKLVINGSIRDSPMDSDLCDKISDARSSRRDFIFHARLVCLGVASTFVCSKPSFATESSTLDVIRTEIQKARKQMNAIPDLIQSEQWDSIRAILITPPLSDLWTKSSRKVPLLTEYATAVGETPSGDELAVLEAKEDVSGHLRFLDMAVYNNNFNPIKSMGETGATKELIRSYYDDPINEYKSSVAALEELIQLGNVP